MGEELVCGVGGPVAFAAPPGEARRDNRGKAAIAAAVCAWILAVGGSRTLGPPPMSQESPPVPQKRPSHRALERESSRVPLGYGSECLVFQ